MVCQDSKNFLMRWLPLSMIEALLNLMVTRLCTFAKASTGCSQPSSDLQLDDLTLFIKFLAQSYIGETGRSFDAGNREHTE